MLTKASNCSNRDNIDDLHRLVEDLLSQLQERVNSGVQRPAAFRILLTGFVDNFDRSPGGVTLETPTTVGGPTRTSSSSYQRSFRVILASTVDKGCL